LVLKTHLIEGEMERRGGGEEEGLSFLRGKKRGKGDFLLTSCEFRIVCWEKGKKGRGEETGKKGGEFDIVL